MKLKHLVTCSFILIFVLFLSVNITFAGRGCTSQSDTSPVQYIDVDKTAPGTKYNATLTVIYETSASCGAPAVDMHMFLRLEGNLRNSAQNFSGTELRPFDGIAECLPYEPGGPYSLPDTIELQQAAVEEFFKYIVNPYIYDLKHPDDPDGCDPEAVDPAQMCPAFGLKSVDRVVEDSNVAPGPFWIMLDLVIAIQD